MLSRHRRCSARRWMLTRSQATLVRGLFSEILQRDLDAVVVHLLVLDLELLAALCAAMEESDNVRNRDTTWPIDGVDLRRRSDIEKTVEIDVIYVVIQGADVYAPQGLVADAEHFQPVALRRNVFIAPPTFLKPDTASRGATAAFEPDALGPRSVSRKTFRVWHFDGRDQIDDFAHVLAFGGGYGRTGNALQQDCQHQKHRFLEHRECLSWKSTLFRNRALGLRDDILTAATNGRSTPVPP